MVNRDRFEIHNEYISKEQIVRLFEKTKLVVLPYTDASQSGVIPIAYAYKKPVIVTDVGSIPETVEDGKTGLIIKPKDVEALANAIVRLLKDDKLRKKMGENGYYKMKADLSWDKIAERTIEVYNNVIDHADN